MANTKFTANYEAPTENVIPFAQFYGYRGKDEQEAYAYLEEKITKHFATFIDAPKQAMLMKQYDEQLIAAKEAANEQTTAEITVTIETI